MNGLKIKPYVGEMKTSSWDSDKEDTRLNINFEQFYLQSSQENGNDRDAMKAHTHIF